MAGNLEPGFALGYRRDYLTGARMTGNQTISDFFVKKSLTSKPGNPPGRRLRASI
jgi:hypothetical protein